MVARPSRSQTTSLRGVRIPSNARRCLLAANPDIHQGTTGLVSCCYRSPYGCGGSLDPTATVAGNGVALPGFCVHRGWGLSTPPQQVDKRLDSVVTHG